ncbi:MAG: dephospho-CoA kinase [Clostridiales bacterium]|nr:dephospho-CoA kinase [Clostridiales bacterium]
MYVLAVTGGLGAGKTTAAEYFRGRGAVVLSLDDIARRQLAIGTMVYQRVVEEFGESILGPDGSIDVRHLAREAFSSPERAHALNAIVHPAVLRELAPGLTEMGLLLNPPRVVVLDVPLLVEAPAFAELATDTLAIAASVETRVARAIARGMSEVDVRARIVCQATDAERQAIADFVIDNDGTPEEFLIKLARFWDEKVDGGA